MMGARAQDPHAGGHVLYGGRAIAAARLVVILVHGRGGSAADILHLAEQFGTSDVAYLAPQAADHSWYPHPFVAPLHQNQPALDSALAVLTSLIDMLTTQGVSRHRVVLLGFSQGACLSLEYAARHAQRYAGVIGLSGGLMGPDDTPRDYAGTMNGTPVFLGCSDIDPHIPVERVRESADVFRRLGATVDERIYPGMGHTINLDELVAVTGLLKNRAAG